MNVDGDTNAEGSFMLFQTAVDLSSTDFSALMSGQARPPGLGGPKLPMGEHPT